MLFNSAVLSAALQVTSNTSPDYVVMLLYQVTL